MEKIIEILNELIKEGQIILGGVADLKDGWAKTYRWEDRSKDLLEKRRGSGLAITHFIKQERGHP